MNTIDQQAPVTLSLLAFFSIRYELGPLARHIHTNRLTDPPHPLPHPHSNILYRQVAMETGSVSTSSTVIPHFLIVFGSLHPSVHPSPSLRQPSPHPHSPHTHIYTILYTDGKHTRSDFIDWQKCFFRQYIMENIPTAENKRLFFDIVINSFNCIFWGCNGN